MPESIDLFGLTPDRLAEILAPLGCWPFAAQQAARWLYDSRVLSFDEMTNLPAPVRSRLADTCVIGRPAVSRSVRSTDGTVRYVMALKDGAEIEAVCISAERTAPARRDPRITLCISSQAGCALGCTFCMTATMGLKRHMTAGEILGQVAVLMSLHALEPNRFNIVFMGMGEPLHNAAAVAAAVGILGTGGPGFGIGSGHITVSTAGMAPAIEAMPRWKIVPRLAVSLNATTDDVRARIMPINKTYPIERLLSACRVFVRDSRAPLFFEYVMLDGVNDTPQDLVRLGRMAASLSARVNLIPFNPTPELPFTGSPDERIRHFRETLVARGVRASVRRSRGRDVRAACGQLALAGSSGAAA